MKTGVGVSCLGSNPSPSAIFICSIVLKTIPIRDSLMLKEKEKAIGLLDSGLGGLSVFQEVKKELPQEKILYYGDTLHAPYGEKNDEQILSYVIHIINFLIQSEVKLIIMACNTASAVTLDKIKEKYPIPVIGVINPGAAAAVKKTRNKKIGIIGTEVTIGKRSYEKAIRDLDPAVFTFSNACSSQIIREMEEQALKNGAKINSLLNRCIEPLIRNKIDTLVLGCTHYPLLQNYLDPEITKKIKLVDPAEYTAKKVKDILHQKKLLNNSNRREKDIFFISGNPTLFAQISRKILGYSPGNFFKSPKID